MSLAIELPKTVKVDNWGIYFLQRLKHFFNRTDYCDLTLQFQDNAQLKVHRLVLSACTEYFELLERTCEMYEDCLVMPDDLQADVVVPIVNFMYTGHLEFKIDLLEKLYQTSQILNMPVLSKLLENHRHSPKVPTHSYSGIKKTKQIVQNEPKPVKTSTPAASSSKRSYSKAFENNVVYRDKKTYLSNTKPENITSSGYRPPSPISKFNFTSQKTVISDPRPTRYEVPEELDTDNIFDNSFCSISYTSQPLMVHPDTVKRYKAKRSNVFNEASGSKKISGLSTIDIVECKRITQKEDSLFDDSNTEHNFNDENDLFNTPYMSNEKDPNQLFDQILDSSDGSSGPKVTIEGKDSKAASNLDHARIISEVLKKYPHLVKSNKNIKLKILDPVPGKGKKQQKQATAPAHVEEKPMKLKTEVDDFTYETDVIDSKQAAKLIAMGAENTKGPWICLICGTPGKALHFNSYYKFRRHLVDVHNEKPVANICEYCGLRSLKRNYLLHHLYAQHGVQPPPQYHFPKCNICTYIALTDALLAKHKQSHKSVKNFRCNVCSVAFVTSNQLLQHIQNTGHKYSSEKKSNLQCIYCMKVFLRELNLYSHIKSHHKQEAKTDGVIDDSDEEKSSAVEMPRAKGGVKFEPSTSYDNDYEDVDLHYPVQQRLSPEKQVPVRRQHNVISNLKQKILNPGFDSPKPAPAKAKAIKSTTQAHSVHNDFFQDIKMPVESVPNNQNEEIVLIDNNEYIMKDQQLVPRKRKPNSRDFIISNMMNESDSLQTIQQPSTSEYTQVQNINIEENVQQQSSMVIKKSTNLNQPIQIVVSNAEEYKALMASNRPIIFDDGGTNKTLTVLSAPHHSQAIDTAAIDLDNTQGSEMMILPHEYPMNVSEAVATENSNIVVVYSHPVDDPNKQFQIITTGGIGAQFVQSSAIITQNYETVTTSTSAMNTHCIERQVEQTWQNNIQSLEGQQIQLPPHTVMINSNQIVTGPIHTATGDNMNELPEVHLDPESQTGLSPGETDVTLNQSDVTVEQINEPDEMDDSQDNVPLMSLIEKERANVNKTVESVSQANSMPNIQTNDENMGEPMEMENMLEQPPNSENILEQPMRTDNILEHQMRSENVIEQPLTTVIMQDQPIQTENVFEQPTTATEIVLDQPMETEHVTDPTIGRDYVVEQPLVTDNVMILEQPLENEMEQTTGNMVELRMGTNNMIEPVQPGNMIVQHVETGNVLEQPIETEQPVELENMMEQPEELGNVLEQPVERDDVIEQPIQMECLIQSSCNSQNEQECTQDSMTINKYSEVEQPENNVSADQQQELIQSQVYDDIVEINRPNTEETVCANESEKRINNPTLDWSEDEYDVTENGNRNAKSVSNEVSHNQSLAKEIPEIEESIENIQQEMQKQMAAQLEVHAAAQLEAEVAAQREIDVAPQRELEAAAQHKVVEATPQHEMEAAAQHGEQVPADDDTEESVISSQEDSSQDMQLPPLNESPVPNPLVQEKLSSLLNDWEDNDSQEETIATDGNVVESTSEETTKDTNDDSPPVIPKNDNIKSLVSDWSDDEEEAKE